MTWPNRIFAKRRRKLGYTLQTFKMADVDLPTFVCYLDINITLQELTKKFVFHSLTGININSADDPFAMSRNIGGLFR